MHTLQPAAHHVCSVREDDDRHVGHRVDVPRVRHARRTNLTKVDLRDVVRHVVRTERRASDGGEVGQHRRAVAEVLHELATVAKPTQRLGSSRRQRARKLLIVLHDGPQRLHSFVREQSEWCRVGKAIEWDLGAAV